MYEIYEYVFIYMCIHMYIYVYVYLHMYTEMFNVWNMCIYICVCQGSKTEYLLHLHLFGIMLI